MRPPKLHVVPIFLHRQVAEIPKIKQSPLFGIPSTLPHPVQNGASQADQFAVAAVPAFMQNEPGAFERMAGIERSPVVMVDDLAVRADGFHEDRQVRLEKAAA